MTKEDIIRMAQEAGLAFDSEEYPDIWQTYMNAGREQLERFAELVAAEYKRDAERYRKLIALLQEAYDGNAIELENSFIVDCSMVSGYKTERRVQAVLGWADIRDEPLNLDAAIDAAMEKVK